MSSDPTTVELSIRRAFSPLNGLRNEDLRALARQTGNRALPHGRPLFKAIDPKRLTQNISTRFLVSIADEVRVAIGCHAHQLVFMLVGPHAQV